MIVTLTGPTAGGKSTLEAELQARGFGRAISHTTRDARPGEVCGEHYHFVNDCTYDALNARGDFIETIDLGTRRYAMSAESLQLAAAKGHVVIVVEPHGAEQIKRYCDKHGLQHLGLWVYCAPGEQAKRWFARTVADLARPPAFSQQSYDAAVERLGLMLGIERDDWCFGMEVYGGTKACPHLYTLYLDTTAKPAAQLAEEIDGFVSATVKLGQIAREVAESHT